MKNSSQRGDLVEVLAPYAVSSGQLVQVGSFIGVAASSAALGAPVNIMLVGCYVLAALSTDTGAVGSAVYWDNTNRRCTTSASGNSKIGVLLSAKSNGVAFVTVRLNGTVLDPSGSSSSVIGPQSSIAGFGDSITFGANASSTPNQWLQKVGAALGATVLNKGASGTVLQNSNGSGGTPLATNGRDRFVADLTGVNKRAFLFIAYGFNDARYTGAPATFNVTEYAADYREILNGLLSAGYTPDTICVLSPYYITDTGLNTGSAGFSGQTRSGFQAFVAAAAAVALEYGCWYCDAYAAMLAAGGATLIDTDNIHPTDAGHQVIATAVLAATKPNTNTAPTLNINSPSSGTINYTIGAVSGATSYTIEYMVDGNVAFTGTVTGSSLTGSFTSLTPGWYTVRVRANFAGGSSGWTPARAMAANALQVRAAFTGTAGTNLSAYTPDIGSAFAVQSGYSPASENVLDGTGGVYSQTTSGVYRNGTAPLGPNYYAELTLKWLSTVTGDTTGVTIYNAAAANTFYFASFFRSDNTWRLYRNSGGSNVQVSTSYSDTFTSGSKVVRLQAQVIEGAVRLTVFIDGVQRITYDDTAPLAVGPAGLRDATVKTSTTGIHGDLLEVYQQ